MKRWPAYIVLVYGLMLATLAAPTLFAAGLGGAKPFPGWRAVAQDALELYQSWQCWTWVGVMMLGQALLLLVPARVARERPVSRRSLLLPILVSGLAMAALVGAGLLALDEFLGTYAQGNTMVEAATRPWKGWPFLATLGGVWLGWTWIFYRFSRHRGPHDLVAGLCRFLLAGSILELLVAVPTHVAVRRRPTCCAGVYTFTGIAVGISVMLFSFGPSVLFLFAERSRRLRPSCGDAP